MPLALHASTPASYANSSSDTSSANPPTTTFSPPANSLIVAAVGSNANTGVARTVTVTNNGAALTWTKINERNLSDPGGLNGHASLWCALCPTARTNLGVTATPSGGSSERMTCIKAWVLTGHDPDNILGNIMEGSTTTVSATNTQSMTTQGADSLCFISLNDWNYTNNAPFTSSNITGLVNSNANTGIVTASGYRAGGPAGSALSLAFDGGGTAAGDVTCNWVAAEIRALVPPRTSDFLPFFV